MENYYDWGYSDWNGHQEKVRLEREAQLQELRRKANENLSRNASTRPINVR